MKPSSAIAKGKELEKFVRDQLRSRNLDTRAHRTPGSGSGLEKGDVSNDLDLVIECKNTAKFSFPEFWRQTLAQVKGSWQKPVLVYHPPQKPMEESVAIIPLDYYLSLLEQVRKPATVNPDRAFQYKLERLKLAASDVLKEIP